MNRKKKRKITKAAFERMLAVHIQKAERSANESMTPQTIVLIEDQDYPLHHAVSISLERCVERGWQPLLTILPDTYFKKMSFFEFWDRAFKK